MREPSFYVSGLLDLDKIQDPVERRAVWRQSMATLARAQADGPGPLDGLQPEALLKGVRPAIAGGLVDDLDWLAPAAAAGALYELANALPVGSEQRELGKRVLVRLLAANAEAFTQIATRMARSSGKGLGSPGVRARIALVTELPIGLQVPDGALALALVSKRELAREWVVVPSTRSLPSRRLAARLFERAAREASRRAAQGDLHALRPFAQEPLVLAWQRLLGDREPLVWRHIAVARGLLAPWVPEMKRDIETQLSASLSMTEWRRAATSSAALAAVSPDSAVRACTGGQANAILARDPGCAAAFVWGIARALEAEPDAGADVLAHLTARAPLEIAEALAQLRFEFGPSPAVDRASASVLAAIARAPASKGSPDDGADALRDETARDLEVAPGETGSLRRKLAAALSKFHTDGARAAYAAGRELLQVAKAQLDSLDAIRVGDDEGEGSESSAARTSSFAVLHDLDTSLLEKNLLGDLLRLGEKDVRAHDEAVDQMRERMSEWILARESEPLGVPVSSRGKPITPPHPTLRLRRLRALLHLVDGDVGDAQEDATRTARLQQRWLKVASALLRRFEADPPSVLRRTIVAALARVLDALVRVGACDTADVLLVLARRVTDAVDFDTLAEASMDPDLVHVLEKYAAFLRATSSGIAVVENDDSSPESSPPSVVDPRVAKLNALSELARDLAPDASGRIETLRVGLERLHGAATAVSMASSLPALSAQHGADGDILSSFESWLGSISQLTLGAAARLSTERTSAPPPVAASARSLSVAVSRVLSGTEGKLDAEVLRRCVDDLLAGIPAGIGRVASGVVWGLADLPTTKAAEPAIELHAHKRLPDWIPPRRTLGGFYVLRGLGGGNVGSVFVVTRYEDRFDPDAEKFALKVPEYSPTAARSLSEAQFLDMFRSEASALLAIPIHPNVARFVTFDAGARPKPILVMELVKGPTLEGVIQSHAFDMPRCLRVLDDVLSGLEAMHGAGVAHLDLKPTNVVLRDGAEAVLVDFGLAGRHIRPGCGTGPYGAPEVWGAGPQGTPPPPFAADVYAFGCVAFEAFTGRVLFDAPNEVAQITQHVAHDGLPPGVAALAKDLRVAPMAELLHATLRRDPRQRPSVASVRAALRKVTSQLANLQWPAGKT